MATRIAECITQKLLASSVIEEGDREIYIYGFFLIISQSFFSIVAVVAGFLTGVPFESVLFYIVFMTLRTYAGGVHAKTEATCTILTTLALTVSIYGIKIMELTNIKLISVLILVSGSICVFVFSPMDTRDKPLTKLEKRHYRKICHIIVSICIVISIVAQILSLNMVYYPIACGVCLEGILLSIGRMYYFNE